MNPYVKKALGALQDLKPDTKEDKKVRAIRYARKISRSLLAKIDAVTNVDDTDLLYLIKCIKRINNYPKGKIQDLKQLEALIDKISETIQEHEENKNYSDLVAAFTLAVLAARQADTLQTNQPEFKKMIQDLKSLTPAERIQISIDEIKANRGNVGVAAVQTIDLALLIKSSSSEAHVQELAQQILELNLKTKLSSSDKIQKCEALLLKVAAMEDSLYREALTTAANAILAQIFSQRVKVQADEMRKREVFENLLLEKFADEVNIAAKIVRQLEFLLAHEDLKYDPCVKLMVIDQGEFCATKLLELLDTYQNGRAANQIDNDLVNTVLDIHDGLYAAMQVAVKRWNLDDDQSVSSNPNIFKI